MNQIINLQSSTRMLGSAANKAKNFNTKNYVCLQCRRRQTIPLINSRGSSTYISALKLMLKKKQNKNDDILYKHGSNICSVKKRKMKESAGFKETCSRSSKTEMEIQEIEAPDVTAYAEDPKMTFTFLKEGTCFYESTRSYDPNFLFSNVVVNKFPEKFELEQKEFDADSFDSKNEIKNCNNTNISDENKKSSNDLYGSVQSYISNDTDKNFSRSGNSCSKVDILPVESDVFKILPLSTVEVFSIPQSFQYNISKKSARTVYTLSSPQLDHKKPNILVPESQDIIGLDFELGNHSITEENFTDQFKQKKFGSTYSKKFELLRCEIDVYLNSNMEDKALKKLSVFRNKASWRNFMYHFEVIKIYDTLLFHYAEKGDWSTVNQISNWIKSDNIKYSSDTYAAILYCLGKTNGNILTEDIQKIEIAKVLKMLFYENMQLDQIFTETDLTKVQNEVILQTIHKVLPYFEIAPTKIILNSDCGLLKNLFNETDVLESHLDNQIMSNNIEELVEEQLLIEKKFIVKIKSVSEKSTGGSKYKQKLDELDNKWKKMLQKGFIQSLKIAKLENTLSKDINLYVYLKCLPVEKFVEIMMRTVRDLLEYSSGYSPSTTFLYKDLGHKIHQCYQLQKKVKNGSIDTTEKLYKKYCSWYLEPNGPAKNTRQHWEMIIHDSGNGKQLDSSVIKWPDYIKTEVGKFLYNIILKEVKISVQTENSEREIPVFYLVLRRVKAQLKEEVKCHPFASRIFKNAGFEYLNFDADQIPMVCPPKPWKSVHHGGYLILTTEYVRKPKELCDDLYLNQVPSRQLYPICDSLNALQAVPWTVNTEVLDIALKVFRDGGCEELNVPTYPEDGPVPLNITSTSTFEERKIEYQRRMEIVRKRLNQFGLWCEALYRLSLANHFRNRIFWLPQNLDFRGRVYPIPPHLNQQGSDLFRSLLLFAKGKPLGPKGLDWIKIQIINLTGTHKKKSVEERLNHANEILPLIMDSAEKPLTGEKWWTKSEEPWQTLAGCIELKKALEHYNPEMYISTYPIHQDGSCNGLQHYAALGRDRIGANSVNLCPNDIPQDVYVSVLEIVERKRAEDAENDVEIAKILKGYLNRKVVKQTIMTTVYGVTYYGARLQIAKQLEDVPGFPKEYVWKAAAYLTQKTFDSLREMFTSAKELQDWFIKCSQTICRAGDCVQWVTPLGLPVKQPYYSFKKGFYVPNSLKQRNAFPPNFIHSLDSSHMMLTALYCEQAGLTYASIHDCFWTHPSSVEKMNRICREQFISLHSEPILENLSQFFIKKYTGGKDAKNLLPTFLAVPKRGNFDIENVLKSVYFFS